MEFGTEIEQECIQWMESINNCRYVYQIYELKSNFFIFLLTQIKFINI